MQVKCKKCNRQAEVYSEKGIDRVIWASEKLNASQKLYWIVWNNWEKAICENCLKK